MAKPCSGSTAPSFGTRSRTWPYDASTSKSVPRYFSMVRALAGDSTMTRFLPMAQGLTIARDSLGYGRTTAEGALVLANGPVFKDGQDSRFARSGSKTASGRGPHGCVASG